MYDKEMVAKGFKVAKYVVLAVIVVLLALNSYYTLMSRNRQ